VASLIDTSVWIDAFHARTPTAIRLVAATAINRPDAVICDPICLELLRGVPEREVARVERHLATVPMLPSPSSLWRDAIPLLRACARRGNFVNTLDGLIAAVALNHRATIVTFDSDFLLLQEVSELQVEFLPRAA